MYAYRPYSKTTYYSHADLIILTLFHAHVSRRPQFGETSHFTPLLLWVELEFCGNQSDVDIDVHIL